MEAPHKVVDSMLDGVANGATGLVGSLAGSVKGIGAQVTTALDKPWSMVGIQGPHHLIDRAANGFIGAVENVISRGGIGSLQTLGKGIIGALDHPIEQLSAVPGSLKLKFRR